MRTLLCITAFMLIVGCRSPKDALQTKVACGNPAENAPILPVVTSPNNEHEFSVDDLVSLGLSNSPRLKEAKHRLASVRSRVPQELSLPDPIVNTTTHLAPVETAAGRQAFSLGVSQKYVNADRLATKAAIAYDDLSVARADLIQVQQEVAEQIRVACFQLLAVRETIRITQADAKSLEQIEEVVLRLYEVKKTVSQQDVLNIQIEQSKVENNLTNLRQKERAFSARLARLVRLPIGSQITLTDRLGEIGQSDDVESMVVQALHSRPELSAQLAEIQRERRKICLANLQAKPDFTFGLNWIATSRDGISPVANGEDALLLGINFNLPIRTSRMTAAKREAKQSSLASMAKLESLQDQITEEVFDSYVKLDSTAMTLSLLQDDIIPKSQRNFDLSIEEYAEGVSDYQQLIENWRSLLKYRVAVVNLQSQRMQLMAALTRQLGQLEPTLSVTQQQESE